MPGPIHMSDLKLVISRFPKHELAIRRLFQADLEFREACEDYASVDRAQERWRDDRRKSEHYRTLIRELEEEILERLDQPSNPPR